MPTAEVEKRTVRGVPVEIRRSARRRRSIHAFRDGAQIVVQLPAALSHQDADAWIERMVERVTAKEARGGARTPRSDEALAARAADLSRRFLGARAQPSSIRWVTNQNSRWGSCTPSTGTIRLSHRLQQMPDWVVDYVIVHELAHLLQAGHGPRFWALVNQYSRAERAQGYLEGVAAATGFAAAWPTTDEDDAEPDAAG